MRTYGVIAVCCLLASCANSSSLISCKPEFVVQWWANPLAVPAGDRLATVKSVTLIHCKE